MVEATNTRTLYGVHALESSPGTQREVERKIGDMDKVYRSERDMQQQGNGTLGIAPSTAPIPALQLYYLRPPLQSPSP